MFRKLRFAMKHMPARNLASVDLNLLVARDALPTERGVTRAGDRIGLSRSATSEVLVRRPSSSGQTAPFE